RIVRAMREGGRTLHCSFDRQGGSWFLSNGVHVSTEGAALVVMNPHVINVGGALFKNAVGQTYRFNSKKEKRTMSDESSKPQLGVVSSEQLDEEEAEFRDLRRDLPGVKGAAEVGLISISVGKHPPKNEFYRTPPDFRPVVPLIDIEVGMDRHYI